MASIDHDTRQIMAKVVWYGPAGSGKTASLQHIWERTRAPDATNIRLDSPPGANAAYYDYLPLTLGDIRGYKTQFGLYTVPGASDYAETRRALLERVDGLVFTADARPERRPENQRALTELWYGLASWGFALEKMPLVLQCTFTDVPGALDSSRLAASLLAGQPNAPAVPVVSTVPPRGIGVFDAMKAIAKLVLGELRKG